MMHSTVPPTLSFSAPMRSIWPRMESSRPDVHALVANMRDPRASSAERAQPSQTSPTDLVNASTDIPSRAIICLAMAPAATTAAVSLPENCPLPPRSCSGNFRSAGRSAWPGRGVS